MASTPTWQAATAAQAPLAAHVTQFLGTHPTTYLYQGRLQSSQSTAGSGGVSSNSTWIAQSFTTGSSQTTIGLVEYWLTSNSDNGANIPLMTAGIYANSGGAPTGGPLISTLVSTEYIYNGPANITIPLPVTGLTPSTQYWIVTQPTGNATYFNTWNKSNQTSGASTSTNGTNWTGQAYGMLYRVWDQTATGELVSTWSGGGQRYAWLGYDTANRPSQIAEFTQGQTSSGYLQSFRTLSYSPQGSSPGPNMIGVA